MDHCSVLYMGCVLNDLFICLKMKNVPAFFFFFLLKMKSFFICKLLSTTAIHKVKCYIVVIKEIGNYFSQVKRAVNSPNQDVLPTYLCVVRLLKREMWSYQESCLAVELEK